MPCHMRTITSSTHLYQWEEHEPRFIGGIRKEEGIITDIESCLVPMRGRMHQALMQGL